MSGPLFAEAIQAAIAIGWALLVWIVVGAAAATAVVLGTGALLVWLVRRTWQAVTRRQAGVSAPDSAPRDTRAATTPPGPAHAHAAPAWALTDKEAA